MQMLFLGGPKHGMVKEVRANPIISFLEEPEFDFVVSDKRSMPESFKRHDYILEPFRFQLSHGMKLVRWAYRHETMDKTDWELACLNRFTDLAETKQLS